MLCHLLGLWARSFAVHMQKDGLGILQQKYVELSEVRCVDVALRAIKYEALERLEGVAEQ